MSVIVVQWARIMTDDALVDLDDVVEPITSTLKVKLKDQATKQDVEKSTELQRSLFRGGCLIVFRVMIFVSASR